MGSESHTSRKVVPCKSTVREAKEEKQPNSIVPLCRSSESLKLSALKRSFSEKTMSEGQERSFRRAFHSRP